MATQSQVPTRPLDRQRIEHFAQQTRRKLVDVVGMAIEALYREQGVPIPEAKQPSERRRRAG